MKWKAMLLILSGWLLILLAACTDTSAVTDPPAPNPPQAETPAEQPVAPPGAPEPAPEPPDSTAEIPFDYAAMASEVLIRHAAPVRIPGTALPILLERTAGKRLATAHSAGCLVGLRRIG